VEVKGGMVFLTAVKYIFITTNIHPVLWYNWTKREQQYFAVTRRIHRVFSDIDDKLVEVEKEDFLEPRSTSGARLSVDAVEQEWESTLKYDDLKLTRD
jgi:hypothetical protein